MNMKRALILIILSPAVLFAEKPILNTTKTCVAYKAVKGMAWVTQVDVIGRNCKVAVRLTGKSPNVGFKVKARLADFHSGNGKRDEGVRELLKEKKNPSIIFEVAARPEAFWTELSRKPGFTLPGILRIAGRKRSIKFQVRNANGKLSGKVATTFTYFGISPPRVGPGGVIADSKDYLELHFSLRLSDLYSKSGGRLAAPR